MERLLVVLLIVAFALHIGLHLMSVRQDAKHARKVDCVLDLLVLWARGWTAPPATTQAALLARIDEYDAER